MGNVLDQISKDNTRFTIFENDQVLTADQLNDLFNYLDVQNKLTRTKAIGVGIIYGLEIGVIDNKHLVVSKGAAITTDGDLLYFDYDQEFDQYDVFEDLNAKYPYFLNDSDQPLPMFELRDSRQVGSIPGKDLATLEATTGTALKDYAGILYLEDYNNDPDLCTGTDCDNKGVIAVKELKILLIHKNNIGALLQSMPSMNKDYFSLDDLNIPRVVVNTDLDTYKELNASFNNALVVKDDIIAKLTKAYQVCKLVVEDDFEGGDPTEKWKSLLEEQFKLSESFYGQYVYDYARDISYAYNELRESLFSDDMLASPDVDLFPKHVLIGLVRDATLKNPIPVIFPDLRIPPIGERPVLEARPISNLLRANILKPNNIRFNFGILIKRFNKIHIDLEYRHHFYESPILNSANDSDEVTRFNFMRIHSMISSFKVPKAEDFRSVDTGLKIIPSLFEDAPLGERSIPFYYSYNASFPINLYWNFNANNRKKENQILSYNSNQYSNVGATITPLKYNILKYTFFRVEGHIGFKLTDVEASLNKIILENNLPINIISVQVEKKLETIPPRPWFFPHLYMYEKSIKSTFFDRMDDADSVNDDLVKVTDAATTLIPATEFKTARQNVYDNAVDIGDVRFDYVKYRSAVSNIITAASNVKAQTKQFTFSNTAIPHDFILNSDILRKTDVISSIYQNTIIKKKTGLMLGNFMKENPGLEHAGGVLRGGTFVIVYTADDKTVVADFMLPYASIDKDVVNNPPIYTPLPLPLPPGTPIIPKFPIDHVFEIIPNYTKDLNLKLVPYIKDIDLDDRINVRVNKGVEESIKGLNIKLDGFDKRLNENSSLFTTVLTPTKFTVPGKDLGITADLDALRAAQDKMERLQAGTPERIAAEKDYIKNANVITEKLENTAITGDVTNARDVNAALAEVQGGISLIKDEAIRKEGAVTVGKANVITRGFKFNR
ncbi:hypothetical protein [Pedobacter sp. V48]|uniref:hypothetical protein n=1 Tax=Pedobacter sp. V48 TaxID=509635 RepID=UPI0003E466B2|nr:hypothetical protein [Pedobacter sp. V48]ETZ22014.1 hypothetical protein N824_24130 [Pedobacter sp. V48]